MISIVIGQIWSIQLTPFTVVKSEIRITDIKKGHAYYNTPDGHECSIPIGRLRRGARSAKLIKNADGTNYISSPRIRNRTNSKITSL